MGWPRRGCAGRRLPHVKDPVLVCGFPAGDTGPSTTRGIVSRINFVPALQDGPPAAGLRGAATGGPGSAAGAEPRQSEDTT